MATATPAGVAALASSSVARSARGVRGRAHSVTSTRFRLSATTGRRAVASPARASSSEDGEPVGISNEEKKPRKPTGELLQALWEELKYVPLRGHHPRGCRPQEPSRRPSAPTPVRWDDARWREQEDAAAAVPEKIGKYWGAKWDNSRRGGVREATPPCLAP